MQKWEYLVLACDKNGSKNKWFWNYALDLDSEPKYWRIDPDEEIVEYKEKEGFGTKDYLEVLGNDGWELVGIESNSDEMKTPGITSQVVFHFKRPKV
jgi:hypothetical protein